MDRLKNLLCSAALALYGVVSTACTLVFHLILCAVLAVSAVVAGCAVLLASPFRNKD